MMDFPELFYITPPYEKDGVNADHEAKKILNAGLSALHFLKKKTSFSLTKEKYFLKIKKKMKSYISCCESHGYVQIVRWVNNTFVELDINKFSPKQAKFVYAVNNLLRKIKEDIRALYAFVAGKECGKKECNFAW